MSGARPFRCDDGRTVREPGPDDVMTCPAGTRFGCPNGHHAYTARRDIYAGQVLGHDDLEEQRGYVPAIKGAFIGNCNQCERSWVRVTYYGPVEPGTESHITSFHDIDRGWISARDGTVLVHVPDLPQTERADVS
jgi:hypothetical protein